MAGDKHSDGARQKLMARKSTEMMLKSQLSWRQEKATTIVLSEGQYTLSVSCDQNQKLQTPVNPLMKAMCWWWFGSLARIVLLSLVSNCLRTRRCPTYHRYNSETLSLSLSLSRERERERDEREMKERELGW